VYPRVVPDGHPALLLYYRCHDISIRDREGRNVADRSQGTDARERRKPTRVELAAELDGLRQRIEALEGSHRPTGTTTVSVADLVPALRDLAESDGDRHDFGAAIVYAGAGGRGDGEIASQASRSVREVLAADPARSARALAALANAGRLAIVGELLAGPVSRQALQARLGRATAGQLNHHLRELLAAGLVEQPSRGVYQVPRPHVVPVLTLLACAADLGSGTARLDQTAASG
jgi:DNA-binding HxlR family transcriptional regulator